MTEPVEPYPAFIRDNPVMQGAFSSFMSFLWKQDGAHEAHCADTNMLPLAKSKSPLDAMIDKATGREQAYAMSFKRWAIDTQWGVEGRDDRDSDSDDSAGPQGIATGAIRMMPHPYDSEGYYRIPDRPEQQYPGYTCFRDGEREACTCGYGADADRAVRNAVARANSA